MGVAGTGRGAVDGGTGGTSIFGASWCWAGCAAGVGIGETDRGAAEDRRQPGFELGEAVSQVSDLLSLPHHGALLILIRIAPL